MKLHTYQQEYPNQEQGTYNDHTTARRISVNREGERCGLEADYILHHICFVGILTTKLFFEMSVSAKVVGLSSCDFPWTYDITRRAYRIVEAIYWFIIEMAI